jgi:thiamine biosynthesis lipoprotein
VKKRASHKQFVLVLFLLWALIPLSAFAAEMLRLEASTDAMGATYSVILYGEDRNKLEAASEDAFEEARRLDLLLSNYKPESEWSKVNREAAEHPVQVSRELFELLAACVNYSRQSEGAFDITVGPLMRVWGFYKGSGHLPQPGELKQAMQQIGYRNIVLDPAKQTVFFTKRALNLDPGGVGKGYAVDRMVEVLKKDGIRAALVSGGGSSIYCLGNPPDEPAGWRVQIKDPHDEFKAVAEIALKNESLSTSGSYEKFFMAEGKTWSHIMDPRTGYPAQGTLSVSVIAPLTLDSEVWAKPYFVLGRSWTATHKPGNFRVFYCSDSDSKQDKKDKAEQPCAWLQ